MMPAAEDMKEPTASKGLAVAQSRVEATHAPVQAIEFRRVQLADQVVDHLRAQILSGGLAPGDRLPSEARLSREFGVGRSTVREALKVLGHFGLIKTRRGSGSYVTDDMSHGIPRLASTAEELRELFEFRFVIESEVAQLAAERRTTAQLARILQALEELHAVAGRNDHAALTAADLRFHRSIADACGNRFLLSAYASSQTAFEEGTRELISMQASPHIADLHDDLAEAIGTKDVRRAAAAVRRTFDEIRMRLRLLDE